MRFTVKYNFLKKGTVLHFVLEYVAEDTQMELSWWQKQNENLKELLDKIVKERKKEGPAVYLDEDRLDYCQ